MTSGSVESYPGHTVGLKRVFGDIARVELGDGLTSKEPQIVRDFSTKDVERFRHTRFTSGSQSIGVRTADQDGFGRFCRKVRFLGQNPKIGWQEFNDLETPKLSKKQLCDRTRKVPWLGVQSLR
jgi:hypothetical protein